MKDGATSNNSNATHDLLKQKFGDLTISPKPDNLWAAHSPYHNPSDFFLTGTTQKTIFML